MKTKYYLQYNEQNATYSIELEAKTESGAKKAAKYIARKDNISFFDIVYKCTNGMQGKLSAGMSQWV